MNRLIAFALAFFVSTLSFSQSDFRKGFIITGKDTLYGFVDYKEGARSYKSCSFKKGKDGDIRSYTPGEIHGYGFVDGKYFESKEVKEENESPKIVFVEVKVNGHVCLYRYDYSFFVAKAGDTLTRLYNKTESKVIDGKNVEWSDNKHIVTLNWLLFDCIELRERIQRTRLYEKELTSLIEDYNKCTGQTTETYNANKPWVKLRLGVAAGLQVSQLEFSPAGDAYRHLEGSFDISKSPIIGFSFDILSPRVSERFSFYGDLLYVPSRYKHENTFSNYYSTERNFVTIELHQLKIPVGIRYTFPEKKVTPYVNAGISVTLNLGTGSTWIQELEGHFNDVFIRQDMHDALPISSNQIGFWGGLGIRKSITPNLRVFLETRYEQTNGFAESSDPNERLRSQIQNFQIVLGIVK